MTAIKFVIVEGNDVSLFSTKEEAEAALEAIDVRDGVYVGYDAEGRLLQISPKGPSSEILLAEAEPTHVNDLRDVLRRHLQYLGRAPETDDLGSLLAACAVLVEKPSRNRRPLKLLLILAAVTVALIGLVTVIGRENVPPLPADARADAIIVDKASHTMTLFSGGQPLRTYAVSLGRGGLEGKMREGDNRTPDGRYRIDGRNPRSAYHLSLRISYPDARDTAAAAARGDKPGGDIMIHGIRNGLGWLGTLHRWVDWTAGCVAVTDTEIEEIWRVVPDGTPVEIRR